jgi:hypothetical protein
LNKDKFESINFDQLAFFSQKIFLLTHENVRFLRVKKRRFFRYVSDWDGGEAVQPSQTRNEKNDVLTRKKRTF